MTPVLLFLVAFAPTDPQAVLEAARARLSANTRALSRYACTQTVERELYVTRVRKGQATCPNPDDGEPKFAFASRDRLRLDLAVADNRETHQWVNGEAIAEEQLQFLSSGGALGTGDYSAFIHTIFARHEALISFDRETEHPRGTAYRYRYQVPAFASAYVLRAGGEDIVIGYHGHFLLDARTAELRSLHVEADDSARAHGWCSVLTDIDFERVMIRGNELVLPSSTSLQTRVTSYKTSNVTHYSQCREFGANSTLKFDFGETSSDTRAIASPVYTHGALLTLSLDTPIDSRTSAVGDLVQAHDIDRPDTIFRGRILALVEEERPHRGVTLRILFTQPVTLVPYSGRALWFRVDRHILLENGWKSKWMVQ